MNIFASVLFPPVKPGKHMFFFFFLLNIFFFLLNKHLFIYLFLVLFTASAKYFFSLRDQVDLVPFVRSISVLFCADNQHITHKMYFTGHAEDIYRTILIASTV